MTITVKKAGGSFAIVIPKAVARDMDLTEGSAVDLTADGGSITLRNKGFFRGRV
jgi:AbrB family looped-hinge helix DNA binding protein